MVLQPSESVCSTSQISSSPSRTTDRTPQPGCISGAERSVLHGMDGTCKMRRKGNIQKQFGVSYLIVENYLLGLHVWPSGRGFWWRNSTNVSRCSGHLGLLVTFEPSGLALNLLRVHFVAILAFHLPIPGKSNSMVVKFLKGIVHLFPPGKEMVPLLDFSTVLPVLVCPPFELLATCPFSLLSGRKTFLLL